MDLEPNQTNRLVPPKFYGVDFSGAAAAGKKIWITGGIRKNDRLHLQSCLRASGLPGSGNERDRRMAAFLAFIRKEKTSAFGFDFPFGLPQDPVKRDGWRDFILSFPFHSIQRQDTFTLHGQKALLEWIEGSCNVSLPGTIRLTALGDPEGDALDSFIGAFATFRALRNQAVTAAFDHKTYLLEWYVYV